MEFLFGLDWAAIVKIIGIDILLGGDNAIVISLACMALVPELRGKAIAYGTLGAVLMRIGLLAIAGLLIGIPYVKFIAGLYLFYIAFSLLVSNEEDSNVAQKPTLWGAIFTIIMADVSMSIDNVLAVTAASQSAGEHAMLYTIVGILFSIPIIVYGSQLIIKAMEKFPIIIWLGGMLLGWVAVEMIISEPFIKEHFTFVEQYALYFKAAGFLAIGLIAKLKIMKSEKENAYA